MHDVIIVGAGPVGLYLAHLLEEKLDVLVLERRSGLGMKADSGLYSTRLSEFMPIQKDWVEHEVVGAVLHSPGGETISLKKFSTAAHVVDREQFNQWLGEQVKSEIHLNTKVTDIEIEDSVTVKTNNGTFESKVLVGCDGASSVVRKHFGSKPSDMVNGLMGITKEKNTDPNVDIYFDKSRISDGFFWKIPRGNSTEYGALGTNVHFQDLENFFNIKEYEKRAAFMNTGLFKTSFPRTILVGEAGGQSKPWSFGGIVFGFTCSNIARDVLFRAFEKGDFSEEFLQKYDDLWKKKLGKTISMGLRLRKTFKEMSNEKIDKYFDIYKKVPFLSNLDMDFPDLKVFS